MPEAMKRLLWLDVTKGLAILWIVYFHFVTTYAQLPSPLDPKFVAEVAGADGWNGLLASLGTLGRLIGIGVSQLGFHAVGLFIVVGGWALAQATGRRAASGPVAWGEWYWARFIRLYPMYWVAHLVYLVSPFVARLEPVDGRIAWSLLGLRFVDIGMNFMYLNAAWWYFAMLIQFYLLFPLFFLALQRLGALKFLLAACGVGLLARYLLLVVFQQSGLWVLGGFAVCRLPEFALGMALGVWHARAPERMERFLLGGAGLVAGLVLYPVALVLYRNIYTYIFTDSGHRRLLLSGGRRRGRLAFPLARRGEGAGAGRRVFLRHLPCPSAVCDLAGPAHPAAAGLGVSFDRPGDVDCAQRLGHRAGKSNERTRGPVAAGEEKIGTAASCNNRGCPARRRSLKMARCSPARPGDGVRRQRQRRRRQQRVVPPAQYSITSAGGSLGVMLAARTMLVRTPFSTGKLTLPTIFTQAMSDGL